MTVEITVPVHEAYGAFDPRGDWILAVETLSKAYLWVPPMPNCPVSIFITGSFEKVKKAQKIIAVILGS